MMQRSPHSHKQSITQRRASAFTLVEMLVAIGLVLLMMTLFAQIFGLASEVMGTQKGLAENDQRARMLVTILRNDLDKRTFRNSTVPGILPIQPGFIGDPVSRGYFYIGENSTTNDADDVLQFTAESNITGTTKLVKPSPFYGRATFIKEATANLTTPAPPANDPSGKLTYLGSNVNQPEGDDGEILVSIDPGTQTANSTGSSEKVEIAYFLRGKNLYRRVMLIRRPLKETYSDQPTSGNPPTSTQFFTGNYTTALVGNTIPNGSGYFWQDFDYSAYYDFAGSGVKFHGTSSLSNIQNALPPPPPPVSLGIPKYRFGFNPVTGVPGDFIKNGATRTFVGRFTHQETSYGGFAYPGVPGVGADGQPGQSGVDDDMNGTTDDISELGYAGSDDDNPFARVDLTLDANNVVKPASAATFDGPRVQEDLLLTNVHAFDIKVWDPGFTLGADNLPGVAGVDDDGLHGTDDIGELGFPGSDDVSGANLNDYLDLGHGNPAPKLFGGPSKDNSFNMNFGNAFDTWHCSASATVGNSVKTDLPYDPTLGSFKVPLRAIQIKIRYVDVASDQMREITLIQSLVD